MSSVYIIIYFLIAILAYFEVRNDQKQKLYVFYGVIFLLILVAGFRYYQGADYRIYVNLFYGSHFYVDWDSLSEGAVEPSYIIISKFVGQILGAPFYWVTFIYAFLSLSMKGNVFYNFSPYPFLSLLMFYMPVFFFEDMGQIRQGVSIAFCAYSYRFIVKKNLLMFLIFVVFGYFFHKSAIVFLAAYWIAPLKIGTRSAIIAIILSILLWPLEIYKLLGPIVENIASQEVSESYTGYLNDNYYGVELEFGYSDIIKFIWLVIIFKFDNQLLKKGIKYLYPRNLTLTFFIIFYLCRSNSIFAVRLPGSYAFFLYILIPTIVFYVDNYYKKLISNYIFLFTFLMMFRFQENARKGGFHQFNNVLIMKNPKFHNEVY